MIDAILRWIITDGHEWSWASVWYAWGPSVFVVAGVNCVYELTWTWRLFFCFCLTGIGVAIATNRPQPW